MTTAQQVALAVLRSWAAYVSGKHPPPPMPPDQQRVIHRSGWLVAGEPARPDLWPPVDLSQPLEPLFPLTLGDRHQGERPSADPGGGLPPSDHDNDNDDDPVAALRMEVEMHERQALTRAAAFERDHLLQFHVADLLSIFQRHAHRLPAPRRGVSLSDFVRLHAAVATAMVLHQGDMVLVGGRVVGGDGFCYAPAGEAPSPTPLLLRGRVCCYHLLTEVCARALLNRAGLPLTSLLAAWGEQFYLLLPGAPAGEPAEAWLAARAAELGRWFLAHFGGDLFLAMGSSTLRDEDFLIASSFQQTWSQLDDAVEQATLNPFASLSHDEQVAIFRPHHQPHPSPPSPELDTSLEALGPLLHQADYLLLHHLDPVSVSAPPDRNAPPTWQTVAHPLGIHLQVCGPHAPLDHPSNLPPDPSFNVLWTTVLALHDQALEKIPPPLDRPIICLLRPILAVVPTLQTPEDLRAWQRLHPKGDPPPVQGQAKDFALLAEQSRGIKRLGVMRLRLHDLDGWLREGEEGGNLAHVLTRGREPLHLLTRLATRRCAEASSAVERLLCLPTGRDYLDILGSWNLLPDLAHRIRSDLADAAGQVAPFDLSAGISLHQPSSPLCLTVEEASSELERASIREGGAGLGWLNQVTTWENVPDLLALKQDLYEATRRGTVPPGLLPLCQRLYWHYRQTPQDGYLFYGPWLWRGEYQLVQMMETRRSARALIGRIRQHLRDGVMRAGTLTPVNEGTRAIERLGLAAHWAALELRKEH